MASVMVLMINGTADCGTAFSVMSRCKEPKEIATTLAFLVAQPMNTGLRRSSDCGPSKHNIRISFKESASTKLLNLRLELYSHAQGKPVR